MEKAITAPILCRMCDAVIPEGRAFWVRNSKKGGSLYGREFECRACYSGRKISGRTHPDSFRDRYGSESKEEGFDGEVTGRGMEVEG